LEFFDEGREPTWELTPLGGKGGEPPLTVQSGLERGERDIIALDLCEATDFKALTDATTATVKTQGALNDKYIVGVDGQ